MHWHVYAQCCRRRLVFGQLDEALHCPTACSWFTPLFFNNFWSKKLNGMFDWFTRGWSASNTSKYWNSVSSSIPSPSTSWVYIFIIKHFELGSHTRDQSDHLALALFLVYKLTCFLCENRQYLTQIQMEMFLIYFIRLIFTLNGWKLLRFVNVFVCLFPFCARLKIAPVTWVFPDSYYAGSGATIWQIRSTHLDAECSGHFQSTPRIY